MTVAAAPVKAEVNYRPRGSHRFGSYAAKDVLPRWVVELSGSSAEKLVREGRLEETFDRVTGDFRAPAPKEGIDTPAAMIEEMSALRAENATLRNENRLLAANNDSLRAQVASQVVSLGEQTEAATHWRQQTEAHRLTRIEVEKRIAELESELEMERATKPETAKK